MKEIEDKDWEDIEKKFADLDKKYNTETSKWEDFKFNVSWNFNHYIKYPFGSFKSGVKNLWKWKKIIWEDRWWDYGFLHTMLHFKLQKMEEGFRHNSWGCGSEDLADELKRLINILEEIEYIENDMPDTMTWQESDKKIDELYQELGEKLFGIRNFENKNCKGEVEHEYETNLIRRLWD